MCAVGWSNEVNGGTVVVPWGLRAMCIVHCALLTTAHVQQRLRPWKSLCIVADHGFGEKHLSCSRGALRSTGLLPLLFRVGGVGGARNRSLPTWLLCLDLGQLRLHCRRSLLM